MYSMYWGARWAPGPPWEWEGQWEERAPTYEGSAPLFQPVLPLTDGHPQWPEGPFRKRN